MCKLNQLFSVNVEACEPSHFYRAFTIIGMLIAVVGSGSTRANLIAFGGNQFTLPEQADQLKVYFSVQIVFHKFGSVLGSVLVPILKEDIKCFGQADCYPLAFGTTSLAMLIGFLIFFSGRLFYLRKPPSGNMFVRVSKCVMVRESSKKLRFFLSIISRMESQKN